MASHVDETTLNNTEIYTTPRDAAATCVTWQPILGFSHVISTTRLAYIQSRMSLLPEVHNLEGQPLIRSRNNDAPIRSDFRR